MDQKALKEKYMDIIANEVWKKSPKMIDYAKKTLAYIVELDNGDIYEIEKPRIETRFCFGAGYNGISTNEDWENASSMAEHARTSREYFIEENLKDINDTIASLKDTRWDISKRVKYIGCSADCKLKAIEYHHAWETEGSKLDLISERERKALIAGYEEVKKAFIKRLNTYLKRYGLSKAHSWTYLSD